MYRESERKRGERVRVREEIIERKKWTKTRFRVIYLSAKYIMSAGMCFGGPDISYILYKSYINVYYVYFIMH